MYDVTVQNDAGYPVATERLVEAVGTALSARGVAGGTAVTVVLTDDASVAALNRQYRGTNAPTDVLSFPAGPPPVEVPGEPPYLGDLVIAFPYARAQAEREGHALADSLTLLVVHGTLHLLGFDHDTPDARRAMWETQAELLARLGVPPDVLPALEGDGDEEDH